jgi:hypothetical protein
VGILLLQQHFEGFEIETAVFAHLPDSREWDWEQQIEVHLLGACENILCI